MRRALAGVAAAASLLVAHPAALAADDGLADWMEDAAGADYRGVGILHCVWGADDVAAGYEVTRHDGMAMVHGPGGDLVVGGADALMREGDDWYAVAFADRAAWHLSERYRLGPAAATVRLGRPATAYTVFEDDRPRVRLVVDDASMVPLLTEVLGADGTVFRMAALVEFSDVADAMPPMPDARGTRSVPMAEAGPTLPAVLHGYRRADMYALPTGGVQAFYSDGLFSFSVFEARRGAVPDPFAGATRWRVGDGVYRRVVTPAQVWVHWSAPDRSYVLVGDLPPDHLEAVLGGLPAPGDRGVLFRLWHRLFG